MLNSRVSLIAIGEDHVRPFIQNLSVGSVIIGMRLKADFSRREISSR